MPESSPVPPGSVDAFPLFVLHLETPTKWVYLNQTARDFIGSDRPGNWLGSVLPEDMGRLIGDIRTAFEQRRTVQSEVRMTAANRLVRMVQHTFKCLLNEAGEVTHLIGGAIDVTEFRQAETHAADRQRFTTAYAFIQRAILQAHGNTACLDHFRMLGAQALDAAKLGLIKIPLNELTIEEGFDDEALDLFQHLREDAALAARLREGEAQWAFVGTQQVYFFPALTRQNGSVNVVAVVDPVRRDFGRSEQEFLKNLANLLVFVDSKPLCSCAEDVARGRH